MIPGTSRFTGCCRLLSLMVLFLTLGCQKSSTPAVQVQGGGQKQDGAVAVEKLKLSLDAWKEFRLEGLRELQPPIRFVDEDQVSGMELQDYALPEGLNSIAPFQNVPVRLTLKNPEGSTKAITANYQVSLAPHVAVLRSEQ